MNCYVCNTIVDGEDVCPYCGADIKAYRMIEKASVESYNDGLQRAKMRDLSGAIESLNRALQYDKYNIAARNLLGLVYYEFGEPVMALREWVISKNLAPKGNYADHFLSEIQHGPGALDKLDQTVKKYNQAIQYCHQGNRDLARIQLKKVLNMNDKMVRARQLLALLYMQDGEYESARKELSAAAKTDVKNPRTIYYMQVTKQALKEQQAAKKKKNPKKEQAEFNVAVDTAPLPRQTLIEVLDSMRGGIINIGFGVLIGLMVTIFLVVPEVRENANNRAASALVDANEEAAGTASDAVALQAMVDALQAKLDKYEGQGDLKTSYEQLFVAQDLLNSGDVENAFTTLSQVNRNLLGEGGQAIYDEIAPDINSRMYAIYYADAKTATKDENYEEAIAKYQAILEAEETYDDGQALYNLAEVYLLSGDTETAKTTYARVVELFEDKRIAKKAQAKIEAIDAGDEVAADNVSTRTTTTEETTESSTEETPQE